MIIEKIYKNMGITISDILPDIKNGNLIVFDDLANAEIMADFITAESIFQTADDCYLVKIFGVFITDFSYDDMLAVAKQKYNLKYRRVI